MTNAMSGSHVQPAPQLALAGASRVGKTRPARSQWRASSLARTRRAALIPGAVLSVMCAQGCGHAGSAPGAAPVAPPAAAAPAAPSTSTKPDPTPDAGAQTPSASMHQAAAQPDAATQTEHPAAATAGEPIEAFMLEHFLITAWVRDSIVDGNLEAIRAPLEALAGYAYQSVAPGAWMRGIAQLQAAAGLTARAQTLEAAASGLATMARICGHCHREQGGPEVEHYKPERKTPKSDRFDVRMYRHAWAAERLWEGLTAPSDNAWQAGASALAHAPAAPPKTHPPLPLAVVNGLARVRELGLRAANAETSEQRADIYGALLLTCAQCHRHEASIEF